MQNHQVSKTHGIRSKDDRTMDIIVHTLLILLTLFFLFPFLNVLSLSISESSHVLKADVLFWPRGLSFEAYKKMLNDLTIVHAFGNSVFVAAVGCIFSLLMTAMAAYPLVFSDVPGKKIYSLMIMLTMWFDGGMVPTFVTMSKYGLVDNLWVLILLSLVSAYNVMVVKAFYTSLPMSLIEAARIDGANDPYILFRIVVPLAKPVLATVALWVIVGHWNAYLTPLIYMRSDTNYTLQLKLQQLLAGNTMDAESIAENWQIRGLNEQLKYAMVVIAMIPMLVIYPFFQRFLVKGVMIGAVKG